ncbi:MAG: protein-glutamate O-methyltransferase CheR [Planctomycetales bacterium]|nr:protein-glutamate O-methyltransferase CheR [Planctomycetales bacterium]MBN8628498.1 protein-glutamate O-methyltransferase CheR [Planctomycetota bacterium]
MSTTALAPEAVSYVCKLVRSRSAIELDAAKSYLIEARLSVVARKAGLGTTADLVRSLQSKNDTELQRQVVEAMTTNETSFFRDIHPFDALRKNILPQLLTARANLKALNIWSAACSTGQEAYSTAMLIRENFPQAAAWKVQILGTDLSDEVLAKAQRARFSQIEMNRGLPAAMLTKYFRRQGMEWELVPELRSMAVFRKLNLIEAWPAMPRMDVVFLRNVLIYFSPETKRMILEKIRKLMAPDAVLFLGAAETTLGLDAAFRREQFENSVFYRLG